LETVRKSGFADIIYKAASICFEAALNFGTISDLGFTDVDL